MIVAITGFGLGNVLMNEAGPEGTPSGGGPAPAPAPAPPTAPAPEPPKQEPAPAPEPAPVPEPPKQESQFEPTGDAGLDYALSYVQEQGIDFDSPAFQAAMEGDFTQLEVELIKKNAPGYDKVLQLARNAYEASQATAKEAADKLVQDVVAIAGSEEAWEETVTWARDNATQEERSAVNSMLEQGGLQAQIAASWLVQQHRGAAGTSYEGTPAAPAAAASAPAPSNTAPLTRVEFAKQAEALYRAHGDGYQQTPEYRSLVSRRQRG